jgi:hypothetical protein
MNPVTKDFEPLDRSNPHPFSSTLKVPASTNLKNQRVKSVGPAEKRKPAGS